MLIRSYLYAPGNRRDFFDKMFRTGTDAIVLDLEDAVPQAEKAGARRIVKDFLEGLGESSPGPIFVRLNSGDMALDDIAGLTTRNLAGVRLAKAEDPQLVAQLDTALSELEAASSGNSGFVEILPLIESSAGLYAVEALSAASPRVRRFAFGAGDFVRDIGGHATPSRMETFYARGRLVAHSRSLGLEPPIAHVFTPIGDLDALQRACAEDFAMGFYGRSCIHPKQVPVINAAFSPTLERINHARRVVEAYEEALRNGRGSLVMPEGTFIDEAVAKRAADVLSLAGGLALNQSDQ